MSFANKHAVPGTALSLLTAFLCTAFLNAAESSFIEEIIVSAQQQKRTIQETQHSIEVFTEADLKRSTYRHMNELLVSMPNVEVDPVNGVIFRGTPRSGYGGDLPTTLTLIDGGYSPGINHFWDAQQIEILRGGQSSVGSASGGTFGITYNPASMEPSGQVLLNYAPSTKDAEVGLAFGAPIIKDKLAFRVAGYYRDNEGFVENTSRNDKSWSDRQEQFFRAQLRWVIDDTSELSISGLYQDEELGSPAFINLLDANGKIADKYKTAIDNDVFDNDTKRDLYIRYKKSFDNGLEMYAIASDHRWKSREQRDSENQPGSERFETLTNNNRSSGVASYFYLDKNNWSFTALTYAFMFDINGDTSFFSNFDFDGPGAIPGVGIRVRFDFPTDHWWILGSRVSAAYTHNRWELSARLSLDVESANNTRTSLTTRESSTGIPPLDDAYDGFVGGFFPSVDETEKYKDSNLSPMLGITYDLFDDVTVGLKWERSFRRGWNRVNGHQGINTTYDPEQADEFDFSLRSAFKDGQYVVNGNIFYAKITDQQVFFSFSEAFLDGHIVNAGKSHKLGVEVNAIAHWGDFLGRLSASLLEAEFDDFTIPGRDDQTGKQLPNTPKWKFTVGVTYDPGERFYTSFDFTARPKTNGSLGTTTETNDARQVLNGRMGWRFDRFNTEVSLWGRNLLNDQYFETFRPDDPGGYVGAPREVGFTVTSRW